MAFFGLFTSKTGNPLLDKIDKLRDDLDKTPRGSSSWKRKADELAKAVYKERGQYLKGNSKRPYNDNT